MAPAGQNEEPVTINNRKYRAVKEGLAQILAPYRDAPTANKVNKPPKPLQKNKPHNNDEGDQAVFYNPIQQYNRDLSVLAILTYGEGAIAAKEDRRAKKGKRSKASAKNAKIAEANVKKRKLDEVDAVDDAADTKRVKSDEGEDEALQVQELGNDEASNSHQPQVTPSTTTNGPAPVQKEKTPSFTILDALSASGLRAIRYAKEIPFATNVVANDLLSEAVKAIELNIDHNDVRGKVHSNVGDARAYMYSKVGNEGHPHSEGYVHRFDVIDLDPYGTAAPFIDAAVQAVTDGGLLCVTCTDAGVFASNGYPEKAYALYGGVTMKGTHSHEAGLRLILNAVATSAAKYGIAIEPLLSLSIDFYARLFIRVHKKPHEVKMLAGTTMITYSCDNGCGAWTTQLLARNQSKVDKAGNDFFKHGFSQAPSVSQRCEHCNSKMHLGGPMWAGPLHNPFFIQRILDKIPNLDPSVYGTTERMTGMLTLALEEDLTPALFDSLAKVVPAPAPATLDVKQDLVSPASDPRVIPRLPAHTLDPAPFFFIPNYLSKVLHCTTPGEDPLRGAIRKLGYQVTRSHCKPGSFKTNAPWNVIWEVMREWVRQESPVKDGKVNPGMPGWKILNQVRDTDGKQASDLVQALRASLDKGVEGKDDLRRLFESGLYRLAHGPSAEAAQEANGSNPGSEPQPLDVSKLNVVFDADLGREKGRRKLVRYQINPRANWGPMSRAGGV